MNGGPADGDSLAPTISEDGKWVAFWSAADNLVDGFNNICQQGGTGVTCLNIYLYNLETGKIEGIPVQYIPGDPVFGVDRISLSADGRYVGFTASSAVLAGTPSVGSSLTFNTGENSSSDMVVNISNIVHSSEAVVYDRETGEYELENQAQDGTAGDGKSSSPVLSANGRFVAFTSTSTNLVAGDTHNYIDVFLRDRETGNVELISVSTVGWKGRGDSGVNLWGWGYYGLNISRDGRYVVFESTASNLGQDLNDECSNLDFNNCNYLYIHDTQTGVTDWINALPSPNYSLFPEISSDGRWVTFMQTFTNCSSSQLLCSNVMLYDRQRGWTTNLTKFNEESPMLSWSYSGSLELPWEAWESNALVFSPDGKLIALGGTDSKIRIWQFSNSSNSISYNQAPNIVEAGINDSFTTLAFTQNGEWLAAGTAGGVIYVWRMADEKLLYSLKDQTDPIKDLVFSQDGAHMVFSTINRVWVWSIGSGDLILENSFSYGGIAVYAIDISPRGNTIASARGDGSIWLQSLPNGKVIGRLGPSDLTANSLAFSEDGSLLATRSSGGTINVWQLGTTGSVTPSITLINTSQFYSNIGALAFSPDNKYLISTGMVGELTLWSVPEGKIFTLSPSVPNGWIYSLAFSKGGNKLAAIFENEIMLWQVPSEVASSFYVHATMDNYVDSKPLPEATANDIPMLQSSANGVLEDHLNLDQTAALLPFPLIVSAHLPENTSFLDATVNTDGSVWLRYVTYHLQSYQSLLYIYEKVIGNSPPPTMTIGASADVIVTRIESLSGSALGEYVRGDWLLTPSITPPVGNSLSGETHDVWQWDNTSSSQRLRLGQNGILIAMYYRVEKSYTPVLHEPGLNDKLFYVSTLLGQGELVQIASGMMLFSDVHAEVTCNPPGQTETDTSMSTDAIGSGQLCSPTLQARQHNITNGALVIK